LNANQLRDLRESGFGDLCDELEEAEATARRVSEANEMARRRYETVVRQAERISPETIDWTPVVERLPILPSPFPIALRFDQDECSGRYELIQPGQHAFPSDEATHWLMLPRAAREEP
jgi:hypothetical protein